MMRIRTLISAAAIAVAVAASPVSARLFNFRVTLDPGTPSGGTRFVQTFNSSLMQGAGSYTVFPDRIEERRNVFGTAAASDNPLLLALQAETGATGLFFDKFEAHQAINDNFVTKSYSYDVSWSDVRANEQLISGDLYRIGDLVVTIEGIAQTSDPASPLAGFYLDTGSGLNTVLRNTNLRFSAVGRVYTYDAALDQVISVESISRYVGSASLVPEPASWALMIGGFGLIGLARRRRSLAAA